MQYLAGCRPYRFELLSIQHYINNTFIENDLIITYCDRSAHTFKVGGDMNGLLSSMDTKYNNLHKQFKKQTDIDSYIESMKINLVKYLQMQLGQPGKLFLPTFSEFRSKNLVFEMNLGSHK